MDPRRQFDHIPPVALRRELFQPFQTGRERIFWMMLIRSAACVGIALFLTAAPAMAGLVGPQRIDTAPELQQVQFRGDDVAGAIIGGAIAGIVGGALGGNCYYNDCDDDNEGYYGGGLYGGPGYYGGGGFYRGGRGFGGRGFHGGGFHGGGAMARGGGRPMGGHMGGGHTGGGHVGGRR
jgi:hypothetical protein